MFLRPGRLYALMANNTKPSESVVAVLEKRKEDKVLLARRFKNSESKHHSLIWTGANKCEVIAMTDNSTMEMGLEVIVWDIGATS